MTENEPRPSALEVALRQAIYDELPPDADDELYEIADRIYEAVLRWLSA